MPKPDYKDTLNLPTTAFPMKANLVNREPEQLAFWSQLNLYERIREVRRGQPKFILHDGPPYANGPIHLGTALNKIIKDAIVKAKSLSNYDAPLIPNWDCHGLPIEHKVEKKVGKVGAKIQAPDFRKACRTFAAQQVDRQMADFQRLGVMADWSHAYTTMQSTYEGNTIRALARMVAAGHLVRGQKPVYWCTACRSALADTEVEYQNKSSPSIDVAFEVIDTNAFYQATGLTQIPMGIDQVIVPIWTTTPWTLPANQAVTVNPNVTYTLIRCTLQDKTTVFVVAKPLLDAVLTRYQVTEYAALADVPARVFEHIQLQHPFLPKSVPILLGDHVTTETGTGLVHTASAHGQDDYVICQRYGIEVENPVDAQGRFLAEIPLVGELPVFKANAVLIEALTECGRLLQYSTLEHSYPHCWRHKQPVIFRATHQWFISMDQEGLRTQALAEINQVDWIPAWGRTRIHNMVASRPDWCISRQRYWGVPIPLFVHCDTGEPHPNSVALMEQVAALVDQSGIDAWFDLKPKSLLGEEANIYDKITDTLDVWFDSGISHYAVLAQNEELVVPADLYFEGSDQHRGWFQTSLLTALAMQAHAPYRTVLTHGYVVDAKGYKMSKSLGNTVAPSEVINRLGADILRLWATSVDFTEDITFSNELLKRISDIYRRIRNTIRFLLSNLFDFNPSTDQIPMTELVALDRWAIEFTESTQTALITHYNQYQLPQAVQKIHHFCAVEMGSFYLDIIKDRLYTCAKTGVPRRSAQTALYHILEALVRWIAPVISFTAEEVWQHRPSLDKTQLPSVFLACWYDDFPTQTQQATVSELTLADWQLFMTVRDEVNKALEVQRHAGVIGSALQASVTLYAEDGLYQRLQPLGDELRFLLLTSEAEVLPYPPSQENQTISAAATIPGLFIEVSSTTAAKCERCWQHRAEVGTDVEHATLCLRCIDNVYGSGEARRFV